MIGSDKGGAQEECILASDCLAMASSAFVVSLLLLSNTGCQLWRLDGAGEPVEPQPEGHSPHPGYVGLRDSVAGCWLLGSVRVCGGGPAVRSRVDPTHGQLIVTSQLISPVPRSVS